jgi:hypothetical protein
MITKQDIDNASMYINDKNIADYGALVESFKVGAPDLKNTVYQGMNRTSFNVLSSQLGMRKISVQIFYKGRTRRELALIKSKIDNLLIGKVELWLPDGFFYTASMTGAGEEQIIGVEYDEEIALCSYSFEGIRHDKLETVQLPQGGTLYCKSLVPQTDCRLICVASENYASIQIGPVVITSVSEDDVLVVDGILGRITQNGALCAGNMSFLHFPSLVPGENLITCPEDLTVEYYPTY